MYILLKNKSIFSIIIQIKIYAAAVFKTPAGLGRCSINAAKPIFWTVIKVLYYSIGQGKMDRAAKVKKYRRSMMKQRYKSRQQIFGFTEERFRVWLLASGVLAAGAVLALLVMLRSKNQASELTYVTQKEFASLMCFLEEDSLLNQWQEEPEQAVTRGQLKDFIQKIGLSGAVVVTGGSKKIEREAFMDYYDQILDYMDLAGAVEKKTILLLEQDGNICHTQDGEYILNIDSIRFEQFYTYDTYVLEHTILGVRRQSDKTIALRNVSVSQADEDRLDFEYQKKEYQILCDNIEELSGTADGTLCIKAGRVTKVKDLKAVKGEGGAGTKQAKQLSLTQSDTVKVLLLNQGAIHYKQIYLTCDGACILKKSRTNKKYKASELMNVKKLKIKKGRYIVVEPSGDDARLYLTDKNGSRLSKGYYGSFIIYRDAEGYYIVNKVNIEKYLYSVVASEMPASFGLEALKAQAVCARSYVYRQMEKGDYEAYHAQIDDSTNYQVYNKSDIHELDLEAVKETAGEVMYSQKEIVNAYYFSSSCGYTSGMEIWNQEEVYPYLKAKSLIVTEEGDFDLSSEKAFRKYISSTKKRSYDSGSKYFRWKAVAEPSACLKEIKQRIQQRDKINPQNFTYYSTTGKSEKKVSSLKGFGGIIDLSCSKRSKSGAILELTIEFEFGKVKIKSEYNIRSVVGCALEKITYADGSVNRSAEFVPSAYFSISFNKNSRRFELAGGGNGHGMGMSQYGAAGMADDGWDYKKILKFYYDGVSVKRITG